MAKLNNKTTLCVLAFTALGFSACSTPERVSYISANEPQPYPKERIDQSMIDAWLKVEEEQRTSRVRDVIQPMSGDVEIIQPRTSSQMDNDLWGTPPESVGKGVTLMDSDLRRRLNDALETTPMGGAARWKYGAQKFMFLPNSAIYNAHHSGGRCRDGILVDYNNAQQQRTRGLFCQTGIGTDWFLQQ